MNFATLSTLVLIVFLILIPLAIAGWTVRKIMNCNIKKWASYGPKEESDNE